MTRTLITACTYQEDIKKSRFVAHAAPATTVEAAMRFIHACSDPQATHHCWAYVMGQTYRYHDDGEPSGTAGRPILQAITGQAVDRVVLVVLRWFGGVKLGPGGLVRAYGGCAASCLRTGQYEEIVERVMISCRCGFAELPLLKSRLLASAAVIQDETYAPTYVGLRFTVARDAVAALEAVVANITRGRAQWQTLSP